MLKLSLICTVLCGGFLEPEALLLFSGLLYNPLEHC